MKVKGRHADVNLVDIDVTKSKSLRILDIDYAQISRLDVSKNLNLIRLVCGNNKKLKVLDVSHNKGLLDLICKHTSVPKLDLSQNPNLSILTCDDVPVHQSQLEALSDMEYLSVPNCGLNGVLDLNRMSRLKSVSLYRNELTDVKLPKSIHPGFQFFSVASCKIQKEPLEALLKLIPDRTGKNSGYLYISDNPGTDAVDANIAKAKNWVVL